ncbi:MAG: hypothetical protein RLZZ337_1736, partial [Bacteroidota bacterium]
IGKVYSLIEPLAKQLLNWPNTPKHLQKVETTTIKVGQEENGYCVW